MRTPVFKTPCVYLITAGAATVENFSAASHEILNIIEFAAASKISLIQIREKKLPANLVFKLACQAVEIIKDTTTKILVNDRADIALAANANGVHLTSQSLPAALIRRNFPPQFIVGVSAHSLAEARAAQIEGADFATFSPIFKTASKEKYGAPQGLEKLREVCENLGSFPIIALGGIDETNYRKVLENGASGFAAIRFLNDANNLKNIEV